MLLQPETTVETRHADQLLINLADFAVATNVLGPGRRAIVWVQGCPRRCPACITPHMQRFDVERTWVRPLDLAARIRAQGPLEGVTFVGGEPFSHAAQLAALVHELRREGDLSVVTYSGHTYERLRALRRPDWAALLAVTDLLIDGEYRAAEHCDLIWRGSANQQLHFLSPRYRAHAERLRAARGRLIEVGLAPEGSLRIIGIPEPGFFAQLVADLRAEGVELEYGDPGAPPRSTDG